MIDKILIITFVLAIVLLSLYYGRNVKNTKGYSAAKYSPFVLLMTFLASSFGAGSTVGDVAKVADDGIIFMVGMAGFWVFCLYISKYVEYYFDKRFEGMTSAGDVMKMFYGPRAEIVTAMIGFTTSALTVSGQLTALGRILGNMWGMSYKDIILIVGIIVIIYCTIGGIKSLVPADVFRFTILMIAMPLMTWYMVSAAGGIGVVWDSIDSRRLAIFSHPKAAEYGILFIAGALPFLWLYPPLIQRFLMTKHASQIAQMFKIELVIRIIFGIMIPCIAFSAICVMPDVTPKNLMPYAISNFLPDGIRGLLVIIVMAASMSSADSHLNASAVLITQNLFLKRIQNDKTRLLSMRLATVCIGVVALYIATYNMDVVELVVSAFALWGAAITVPLVMATMRFKHNEQAFWGSVISSIAVHSLLRYFGAEGFVAPLASIFASVVAFFIVRAIYDYRILIRHR